MKSTIQTTLLGDAMQRAKTNKKEFLEKMDSLIPWEDWVSIIKPIYYKGRVGQKPYAIELMLRIYILQNFYDLSDMGVMYEILDSRSFSDFCGVSTPDQVPNGDTIGNFRNLLIRNNIQEQIFAQVVSILTKKHLILKKGTIVDSTLIAAPSSTKNADRKRDPEAHSVKKGNQWHFGYKAHIGVDSKTGLVHHVKATAANVHDVNAVDDIIYGDEDDLYGDSAYLNVEEHISEDKKKAGREYNINRRRSEKKKLDPNEALLFEIVEFDKSTVRSKAEHVFGVVKRLFRFRRTRYRGLRKQQAKFNFIFALANLYLADKKNLLA